MQTRRKAIVSMIGALAFVGNAKADDPGLPKATILPGKPPLLDFGEGLKVPCDKSAFLTLWEGQTFWLTFGFASSSLNEVAKKHAVVRAVTAMRTLLLTLAFTPARLKSVDGHGWRQKEDKSFNYVIGELDLPGRASKALDDVFLGGGNVDSSSFWGDATLTGPGALNSTQSGGMEMDTNGILPSLTLATVNAFCCYVVMKKDLSLDDVRHRAKIL